MRANASPGGIPKPGPRVWGRGARASNRNPRARAAGAKRHPGRASEEERNIHSDVLLRANRRRGGRGWRRRDSSTSESRERLYDVYRDYARRRTRDARRDAARLRYLLLSPIASTASFAAMRSTLLAYSRSK
jgi:hypothetical protein